ncbi:MAG TPA: peptidylprolyl isomerase [Ferruginibacter sp.]|nr:peptidylprolyl isomerase [Chitinophagaceae bacterium]HML56854.1 peptidylprolyl isomerase [Ferruginibacter sp.]HRN91330.1 peptidylprolyl isomerase [Ferruginibacter sp.]HRO05510.1 peptidylprolyl isomerase [Ferruginibacter sp.]HRO96226.1 peptidylprolyl isomerase [Ferruginibacter sp.]
MTKKMLSLALLAMCFSLTSLAQKSPIRVQISTDSGTIVVRLYDETPLHRDNFIKLVRERFYDSLLFHRVIPEFMIQGGDPTSKNAQPGTMLGGGGGNMERIPAEFHPNLFHKKGALAAARDNNPAKASSACQFYLVQGKKYTDGELSMIANRTGKTFSDEQRKIYTTVGGTPFLDQDYTVFGEIESGMEVVDKIVSAQKDGANRPLTDIRMQITELP